MAKKKASADQYLKGFAKMREAKKIAEAQGKLLSNPSPTRKAKLSYVGNIRHDGSNVNNLFVPEDQYKPTLEDLKIAADAGESLIRVARTRGLHINNGRKETESYRNQAYQAAALGDFDTAGRLADIAKFHQVQKQVWGDYKPKKVVPQGKGAPKGAPSGKPQGKSSAKGGDGWHDPKEKNPFKRALGMVLGAPGVQQALKAVRMPYSYVASHVSDVAQEIEQGDIGGTIGALGRGVGLGVIGEAADAAKGKGFDIAGVLNSYENEKNRKDFWKQTGVGEYLQRGLDKHHWDDGTILNDKWVKRGIGLAGDIGLDPLTYLTAGTTKLAGSGAQVATRITEAGAELAAKEGAAKAAELAAQGADEAAQALARETVEKETMNWVKERAATVAKRGKNRLSKEDVARLFPDEKVAGGLAWRVPGTGRVSRKVVGGLTGGKVVPEEKLIPLLNKNVTNPMQRVLSKPARALGASKFADKMSGKFAGELGQELRSLIRSGDPEQVYKGLGIKRATNLMRSRAASGVRIAEQDMRELFGDEVANKLIINAGKENVGPNLAKLWMEHVAPAIKGREEEVLRAVEQGAPDTVEGASEVVKFYEAAHRALNRAGGKMGKIGEGQYIPRQFTEEGRRALQEVVGDVPEGTTAIDPRVAFEKNRTLLEGMGVTNMDEARAMLETMYGRNLKGGKVFETDLHKITANYIRQADQRLGRQALLKELEGWGIAQKLSDDDLGRIIKMAETKSPKVAANNVVNTVGKSLPFSEKRKAQRALQGVLEGMGGEDATAVERAASDLAGKPSADAVAAAEEEMMRAAGVTDQDLADLAKRQPSFLKERLRPSGEVPPTAEEQASIDALREGVTGEPIPASDVVNPTREFANLDEAHQAYFAAIKADDPVAASEAMDAIHEFRLRNDGPKLYTDERIASELSQDVAAGHQIDTQYIQRKYSVGFAKAVRLYEEATGATYEPLLNNESPILDLGGGTGRVRGGAGRGGRMSPDAETGRLGGFFDKGGLGPRIRGGEHPNDPFVPYSDAGPEYQIHPNPTYMDPEGLTGGTWIKNYDTSVDPEDFSFASQQEVEQYAASVLGDDFISLIGGTENLDGVEKALLRRGAATPQMEELIRNVIKNRRQMPLMTRTTLNSSIDSYFKLGNPTDEMISVAGGMDRSNLLEQRLLHIAKGMFDNEANMVADGITFNSLKEAIATDPFADELTEAINTYAAKERYALARENYLNAQAMSQDAAEARGEVVAADSWDTLEAEADAYAKEVRDKFLESNRNVDRVERQIRDIEFELSEGRLSEKKFVELVRRKEALEDELWNERQITALESAANDGPVPFEEQVKLLRRGMPSSDNSVMSLQDARLMDALMGMRRQLAEHNSLNMEMADEAIKRIETMRNFGYTMVDAAKVGGPKSWNVPSAKRIEAMNLVDATADDIMRIRGVGTQAFNTYVSVRTTLDTEIDSLFNAFQQKVYTSELPQPPRVGSATIDPEEIAARIELHRPHGPAEPMSKGPAPYPYLYQNPDAVWTSTNITDNLPIAWNQTPAATQHANIQNVINQPEFSQQAERLVNLQRQNLRLQNAVLSGDSVKFRKAIILHFLEGAGGRPIELPDELFNQYVAAITAGDLEGIDAFVMKMPFPEHPMRSGSLTGRIQGPPAPIAKARSIDPSSVVADFSGDANESIKSYYAEAATKYELERQKLERSYDLFVEWTKLHRSDANGKIVYRTEDLATLRELKKRFEALVKPDPSANPTRVRTPLEEYAEIGVGAKGRQIKISKNGTVVSRDNIFNRVATLERDAKLTKNYRSLVESRAHLDDLQQTAREQHAAAKAAGNKEAMREARIGLNNIKEARLRIDERLSELGLTDSKGIAANGRKVGELKAIKDLGLVEQEGVGVLATADDLPRLNDFIAKVQRQLDQTSRFGEKGYWKIVTKDGRKQFANLNAYQFEIGRLQGAIEKAKNIVEKVNTLERLAQARKIATTNTAQATREFEELIARLDFEIQAARTANANDGTLASLVDQKSAATLAHKQAQEQAYKEALDLLDPNRVAVRAENAANQTGFGTGGKIAEALSNEKIVAPQVMPSLPEAPLTARELKGVRLAEQRIAEGRAEEALASIQHQLQDSANLGSDQVEILQAGLKRLKQHMEAKTLVDDVVAAAPQPAAAAKTQPKASFAMNFAYGADKRAGIVSDTTFDAILAGERTSTTRWNATDMAKSDQLAIGDTIEFTTKGASSTARVDDVLTIVARPKTAEAPALFTVTSKATGEVRELSPAEFFAEWSRREGWSEDWARQAFTKEAKKGKLEARQVVFSHEPVAQAPAEVKTTLGGGGRGPKRGPDGRPENPMFNRGRRARTPMRSETPHPQNPVRSAVSGSEGGQDALNAAAAASEPEAALEDTGRVLSGETDDELIASMDEVAADPSVPPRKQGIVKRARNWMNNKKTRVATARVAAGGEPVAEAAIAMQSQAENAGIYRFVRYPTSDPTETFKQLNNLDSLDDLAKMADEGMNNMAWLQKSQGYVTDRETAAILNQVATVNTKEGMANFLKYYDKFMSYIKAWQLTTPGFHVRNTMGGIFNNYLAGVEIGSTSKFLKNMQRFKAGALSGEEEQWMNAIYETVGSGQYSHHEIGVASNVKGNWNPLSPKYKPLSASAKFGGDVEFRLRGALMWDRLSKGKSLQEALEDVTRYHFDYANLSNFETGVVKRIVPFYVWTRYNFPLQIEMMAQSPSKYRFYQQFKHSMEGREDKGKPVPSFLQNEMFGIPLPTHIGGGQNFLTLDLPFTRTMAGATPDVENWDPSKLGTYPTLLDPYLSQMAVPIKTPAEMALSRQFFKGIPLRDTSKTEGYFVGRSPIAGALGGKTKADYLAEQLFPAYGQFRRLFPTETKNKDRLATNWSSYLGAPLRTNTKQDQENELARRRYLK